MPHGSLPGNNIPAADANLPPAAGLDGAGHPTVAEVAVAAEPPAVHRVGWGFIALYALAYMSTGLVLLAPVLVTSALKVNSLVGIDLAPNSLALVAGIGSLVAMFANPFFGRMSDRTSSHLGRRRPWMVIGLAGGFLGILIVAVAPNIPVVVSDGASPSCSSTHCSPPWWRCCPTRSRRLNADWSRASWVSAYPSRR